MIWGSAYVTNIKYDGIDKSDATGFHRLSFMKIEKTIIGIVLLKRLYDTLPWKNGVSCAETR